MKIQTVNQLISVFKDIATRHYQINGFGIGDSWEIGADKAYMHPVLWINPVTANMPSTDTGYKTFEVNFEVRVFDLVHKNESNESDVLSDTVDILKDIITEFRGHPYYVNSELNIVGDISFEAFTEEFDEEVSGWICEISLMTPMLTSFCGIPAADITGFEFPGVDCPDVNVLCPVLITDIIGTSPIIVTEDGTTRTISIDTSGLPDTFVTTSVLNGSDLELTRNDGVVLTTDLSSLPDVFVTTSVLNGTDLDVTRNDGVTITTDLSSLAGGGGSITADNGLNILSGVVELGGTLNKDTNILGDSNSLTLGGNASRLNEFDINATISDQSFTYPGFSDITTSYTPGSLTHLATDTTGNLSNTFTFTTDQGRIQVEDTSLNQNGFLDVKSNQVQAYTQNTSTFQSGAFDVSPNVSNITHSSGSGIINGVYLSDDNITITMNDGALSNSILLDETQITLNGTNPLACEIISLQDKTLISDEFVHYTPTIAISDSCLINDSVSFHIDGTKLAGRYKDNSGVVTDISFSADTLWEAGTGTDSINYPNTSSANTLTGNQSVILGGGGNTNGGVSSIIISNDSEITTAQNSTIVGGENNVISSSGLNNSIFGTVNATITTPAQFNSLFGGVNIDISGPANNNEVFGGVNNSITNPSANNVIVGGTNNEVNFSSASFLISGGNNSLTGGGSAPGPANSGIIGGVGNTIDHKYSVILNSKDSSISRVGFASNGIHNNVLGGQDHIINVDTNSDNTIIGGNTNTISSTAERSVILGGQNITATQDDMAYVQNLEVQTGLAKYSTDPTVIVGFDALTLVNKDYVDTQISAIPAVTVDNGLNISAGGDIELGGSVTSDVVLSFTTASFILQDAETIGFFGNQTSALIVDVREVSLSGNYNNSTSTIDLNEGVQLASDSYVDITAPTSTIEVDDFIVNIAGISRITDSSATPKGIQYNADYSSTFINRSLVDKDYVDTAINNIPAFTADYCRGSKISGNLTATYATADQVIPITIESENSNTTKFTIISDGVRVNQAGRYRVNTSSSISALSNTARANPIVTITVNGVTAVDANGQAYQSLEHYGRNAGSSQASTSQLDIILDLAANDIVKVVLKVGGINADTGVVITSQGTHLEVSEVVASQGTVGFSGTFTNGDGNTVTVDNGIITNIV